eukprot:CAMPEP_0198248886 /NCGR_PEP_ID=MMETSP1447-20131203/544_1 /TAXON_ID=420782 /ORGANISM="Chaetoceros dichaeta, Strain CCMP1751" /LENGTH=1199 /DNA_ID=CAMNT_0043933377 /DNA_START=21 /DNA_END=3621 /DNA_ORIENTATION=+
MKKLLSSALLAAPLLASLTTTLVEGAGINHGEILINWLRANGGTVNEKLVIRRADPNDPESRFGMFTTGDLARKEVLLIIPDECVLSAAVEGDDEEDDEEDEEEDTPSAMNCQLVRNLVTEMKLGDESHYAPYVNYLLAEPFGQLPSSWSNAGRAFLTNMLEKHTTDKIPPIEPADWLDDWYQGCKGSRNRLEEQAALHVTQRSWDDILIPVYDMMSHRNGIYFNTESNSVHGDADITVKAKRDIKAGEEINTSYNLCEDCGNRRETYGSPEILRDYGFVEQFPQRWIFPDSIGFEIDEKVEGSGDLSLSWLEEVPNIQDVVLLRDVSEAMKVFGDTKLKTPSKGIASNEIERIREFHAALTLATNMALKTAYSDDDACHDKSEDQVCVIPQTRYADLSKDWDMDYEMKVCDIDKIMEFNDYDILEEIQTPYQFISVMHNPTTEDTCFDLDDTVQICSNYRPHYHEMSVHYAARYLKRIERVLFVGGGDSMLLHEVLLYPTIKTVVGLELDQKVTRMSFKYFGSQPHWDNEKVEWWFGDATKSLLMVPKEYFGSFDMVLVDLSETVMSFKVTTGLDIMETLALLLKPDGLMLKNEVYFEAMSDIFEHTLQYFYFDVPVICSQSMVIGSNNIDFYRQENLTDHGIDTLLIGPLNYDEHFALYHDYAQVPDNRKKHCMRENDELEKAPLRQASSPGIIMIIEAEEASILENSSSSEIVELVSSAIKGEGYSIVSTILPEDEEDVTVIVMKEGYVVLRLWPDLNYCGYDIHLWSRFEKQGDLKKVLLSAVGSSSTSSSSFRIVAGGMFGVNTWKSDEKKRGPRRTLDCDQVETKDEGKKMSSDVMDIILEENMKFVEKDATVLVVCGVINSQPCNTLDRIKKDGNFKEIIDVWSCTTVNEFHKESAQLLYSCERDLLNEITRRVGSGKKIGAIIIDPTMPFAMGQVLVRIFTNLKSKVQLLTGNPTVIATSMNETEQWRSNMINRFRTDVIIFEPLLTADTTFEGAEGEYIDVHIIVTNDKSSDVIKMREILKSIEERTGVNASIEEILGGSIHYEDTHNPIEFLPSDYDRTSPTDQWASQEPLEFQTIFQMEVQREKTKLSKSKIKIAVEKTLASLDTHDSSSGSAIVHEFSSMGDGCLLIAVWSGSSVMVIWDGRSHVDINLTIDEEDDNYFDSFEKNFIKELPSLKQLYVMNNQEVTGA